MDKIIIIILLLVLPAMSFSQVDTTGKKVLSFIIRDNPVDSNTVWVIKNKRGGKIIAYRRYKDEDWIIVDTSGIISFIIKALPKQF